MWTPLWSKSWHFHASPPNRHEIYFQTAWKRFLTEARTEFKSGKSLMSPKIINQPLNLCYTPILLKDWNHLHWMNPLFGRPLSFFSSTRRQVQAFTCIIEPNHLGVAALIPSWRNCRLKRLESGGSDLNRHERCSAAALQRVLPMNFAKI